MIGIRVKVKGVVCHCGTGMNHFRRHLNRGLTPVLICDNCGCVVVYEVTPAKDGGYRLVDHVSPGDCKPPEGNSTSDAGKGHCVRIEALVGIEFVEPAGEVELEFPDNECDATARALLSL